MMGRWREVVYFFSFATARPSSGASNIPPEEAVLLEDSGVLLKWLWAAPVAGSRVVDSQCGALATLVAGCAGDDAVGVDGGQVDAEDDGES